MPTAMSHGALEWVSGLVSPLDRTRIGSTMRFRAWVLLEGELVTLEEAERA